MSTSPPTPTTELATFIAGLKYEAIPESIRTRIKDILLDAIGSALAGTHGDEVIPTLDGPGPWHRLLGVRANASTKSHAELDESEVLDDGDLAEFADE